MPNTPEANLINWTKRKGSACRTAVALGVNPSHLKALGPENACPIFTCCAVWILGSGDGEEFNPINRGRVVARFLTMQKQRMKYRKKERKKEENVGGNSDQWNIKDGISIMKQTPVMIYNVEVYNT
ncbi:predicted protein [Sclerotinia sclerotiorum 1980 UF-70]|uniref:Uncharacterized protein n=1 Tax=Sclerotinia sclerotiorum (strain ATCC 18683 / 1980 / Ss-1) TaxID=665079 RepID=A7F4Y3_SCLS1|nr:predicted protein [Sclerotinia sclerotiorum 1980 UF-70]EDN97804.1 predicted protein [Sclerotinia sclerotiorum 1980 UF-70]